MTFVVPAWCVVLIAVVEVATAAVRLRATYWLRRSVLAAETAVSEQLATDDARGPSGPLQVSGNAASRDGGES